ncbi:MAG: hypothetical protein JO290_01555 [Sphingomonadaceae bacterium]|nr:hypothetical protein [Sphingomonadaceae bacterium]
MSESEQARSRRRWITLGEIVGICALIVSALSYWDTHQERKAATAAPPPARIAPLTLTGTVDRGGDRIALKAAGADQVVQTQSVRFPTMVKADAVETTGNPHIDAIWFEAGLRSALKDVKLHSGRHRLPVVIETTYVAGALTATDLALYDLGYSLHARLLRPDVVTIEGISLVRRGGGDLQALADARFVKSLPNVR